MKEKIKLCVWNKIKSSYPSGTSKHTNAILEEDFDSLINDILQIIKNEVIEDLRIKTLKMENIILDSYNEDAKEGGKIIIEQFKSWLDNKEKII